MAGADVKPKLLIIELWAVGDVVIGTPILRKACEEYEVTLLAKPFAADLRDRFWPEVKVIPFSAPWTAFAFRDKYRLYAWPWRSIFSVSRRLVRERFDVAVSARWDPRDHFLMKLSGARKRLGYPRMGSGMFLTHPLRQPDALAHRYEGWRVLGEALGLKVETADQISFPARRRSRRIVIHSGAAQAVRVWPLARFHELVRRLRERGHEVAVLCNPDQRQYWEDTGEIGVKAPGSIAELLAELESAGAFIGNDSGPGHLAAFCGVPTFTLFGPQVPEWFRPLHPASEIIEGKPCPYKPCSDSCRFPEPHCLWNISQEEAWQRVKRFVERNLSGPARPNAATAGAI
jgi:heptosyltransferase-2